METPELVLEHGYKYIDMLGKGQGTNIYKAEDENNNEYAIKEILKENIYTELIRNEIKIMTEICHKNLMSSHEWFENYDYFYIVMDYVKDTIDLFKYIENYKLKDNIIKYIMNQVSEGLKYLHKNDIAHQDIKLGNILLDKNGENVKLIDYGIS